jgi:hypothetical protein
MNTLTIPAPISHALRLWREDSRFRVLIYGALAFTAMIPLGLAMQVSYGISSLKPLQLWLSLESLSTTDSWRPMRAAYDWLKSGAPDGTLYREIFFEQRYKFQYAPTSLLPYALLDALGIDPEATLLNRINQILVLLSAVGIGAISWLVFKRASIAKAYDPVPMVLAVLAGATTFLYFPMMYGYQLGQLQVWNNALFIGTCLAWLLNRKILAGVLLALVCLLKPQLALFCLWGLFRKEWRFLAAMVVTGATAGLISLALFGIQNHIAYLEALSFMSRHGEAHLSNHSINGLLHRLTGNDDGLSWSNESFPPYNAVVHIGTLISSIGLIVLALWRRGAMDGLAGLLQLMFAAVVFTIASPMAWEPHYGVLAPTLAALAALVLAMEPGDQRRKWLLGLGAAIVVSGTHLPVVAAFSGTPLMLLQPYLMYVGAGVLFMLWRLTTATRAIG